MTKFMHIAPTSLIDKAGPHQLALAHLIDGSPEGERYAERIKGVSTPITPQSKIFGALMEPPHLRHHSLTILDNSAFEMNQQGKEMLSPEVLIDRAKQVLADYIVLPDYPGQPARATIDAAMLWAPKFKEAGFGTFFCPQSEIGDIEGLISAITWAAHNPLIDYIALSILNVPNAYGIDPSASNQDDRLARYLCRYTLMKELRHRGILELIKHNSKRLHFLGMFEPGEVDLITGADFTVNSWDSSSAVWHAVQGIMFDETPTGLRYGKSTTHVDFNYEIPEDGAERIFQLINHNIQWINRKVRQNDTASEIRRRDYINEYGRAVFAAKRDRSSHR